MTTICRYLDDAPRLFWWELDEVGVLCLFLVLGTAANSMVTGGVIGMFVASMVGKLKQTQSEGYMLHALYFYAGIRLKNCPPGAVYDYYE